MPRPATEEGRKTTLTSKEEDDLKKATTTKKGEEFERLQAGWWGEKEPRLVRVPGLQPYIPLPQRKVGRLRNKVARPCKPWSQPRVFKSRDIREFFGVKTRAVVHNNVKEPMLEEDIAASAGSGGLQREKRRWLGKERKRGEEKNLVEESAILPARSRYERGRGGTTTPPVESLSKLTSKEEDFCQTPKKGRPAILVESGRKRLRQETEVAGCKKARLMMKEEAEVPGGREKYVRQERSIDEKRNLVSTIITKFEGGGCRYLHRAY